jgi:hypothetical protein
VGNSQLVLLAMVNVATSVKYRGSNSDEPVSIVTLGQSCYFRVTCPDFVISSLFLLLLWLVRRSFARHGQNILSHCQFLFRNLLLNVLLMFFLSAKPSSLYVSPYISRINKYILRLFDTVYFVQNYAGK